MVEAGQQVPHFTARGIDGRDVAYASIWQHKHLLLVSIRGLQSEQAAVNALQQRLPLLEAHDTALVITASAIGGIPRPGVVIADRWGEIGFVAAGELGSGATTIEDALAWVRFVAQRCPECEGESR